LGLIKRTHLVEERPQGKLFDLLYRASQPELSGSAWVITPRSHTVRSYVVFLHGGGQDRSVFIGEAFLLASAGITSLLVDLPQARMFPQFENPQGDLKVFQESVESVRCGIDCLAELCQVDERYGAIVGFSFGGWISILAAARDHRLQAAALAAVLPRMSEFWRYNPSPEVARFRAGLPQQVLARYAELLRPIDAIEYLGQSAHLRLFFQFGSGDELVTEEHVREFRPYADGDNALRIYPSQSHNGLLLDPDARRDRLKWLVKQSGISTAASAN
jgi:cephalosporin-C deacetylase-like acetyl esterase